MTRRLIGVAVSAALGSLTGVVAGSMYNSRREPAVSSTAIFISQPDVSNMRCKPVREVGGQSTHIAERCENDEVVCYAAKEGGMACSFKEESTDSLSGSSGKIEFQSDGTITITPEPVPMPSGSHSFPPVSNTPTHIEIKQLWP